MLAYSAQELILEPFAGAVLSLTPAQTAGLTGLHQAGVLGGMALVALAGSLAGAGRARAMRAWTAGGCVGSAVCLLGLALAGLVDFWPVRANAVLLGVANGAFAVSAIGAMLGLAGQNLAGEGGAREGVRVGVWGAAQAVAMGLGGLAGTGCSDAARAVLGHPGPAYALVFTGQAALFMVAARLGARIFRPRTAPADGARLSVAVAA